MKEKLYNTVGRTGGWNITIGVIIIVVGLVGGIMLLISGARLLAAKSKILF